MNEDLKAVRKSAVQMREGRAFHVMGTACAKAEPSPVRLVVATSLLFFLAYSDHFVLLPFLGAGHRRKAAARISQDNVPVPIFQKERPTQAITISSD